MSSLSDFEYDRLLIILFMTQLAFIEVAFGIRRNMRALQGAASHEERLGAIRKIIIELLLLAGVSAIYSFIVTSFTQTLPGQ